MTEQTSTPTVDTPTPQEHGAEPKRLRIHEKMASRKNRMEKPKRPPEVDISPVTRERPKLRDLDALIEDELESAMAGLSDKDLLAGDSEKPAKSKGEALKLPGAKQGRVVSVHHDDVFVEMPGNRSQGVLSMQQFPDGVPEIGTVVEFTIQRYDAANGLLILTREGAVEHADWSTVHIGQIVEARCTEVNRGGLAVEVNNLRGFLPISQIDMYRVENAEQFVNQRLRCMVVEADPIQKNLVVSRRALLEAEREELAKKVWEELAEGQVRKGFIRQIKPFGAFADIGGVDGLIPISEMSWSRIKDPSEVLQLGETVEVVVTRIDRDAKKVSLSLRQTKPSPWDTVHLNYPEKTVASGTVSRIEPFGAFVEIEPGIEGLIHISELAGTRVRTPGDVVQVGQKVQVKILSIDRDQRRMALSLKQVKEAEVESEETEAEANAEPPKQRVKNPNLRGGTGAGGPLFPQMGKR